MRILKITSLGMMVSLMLACQGTDKSGKSFDDSSKLDERADSVARAADQSGPTNETNESNVDGDGAAFMKQAALGGMMEVELGQVALAQASNPKVKDFGAKMVADHQKAGNELKTIAEQQGILLPAEYSADIKAHLEALKKLKGAEFDKQYMEMMVKDHVKTINLFKSAGLDKNVLKDFVSRNLPVLEGHHKLAVEINNGL